MNFLYSSDGFYIQAFARVSPGEKVQTMEPTAEGNGGEEKFVTIKHDFDSFQNAPVWLDDPKVSEGRHSVCIIYNKKNKMSWTLCKTIWNSIKNEQCLA